MKNSIFRIFILLNFCLLTFAFSLQAQPPLRFSYQSILRNPGGQALTNQPVGMRLSILQGSESGTAVYVETHNASTNASGLVTLQVGGGTLVSGSMATIDWAAGPYFIKTETDPEGGSNYSISGTSQLLSVPYALYSANGTPGPEGPAGSNGKNALIRTTPEAAGANCANGGVKIEAGLDADGNGQLSDAEVNASQTKFICNGSGSNGTGLPSNPPYGTATLYNCDGQFQYSPCVPKVVTNSPFDLGSTMAILSGKVTNDGGSSITESGFRISTQPNGSSDDLIFPRAFTSLSQLPVSKVGGLQPGTSYFVKAYATNGAGTAYGNQMNFITPSGNTISDADGNNYTTVTIGTQVWMKENLKTGKYRNGNPIPTNLSDTDWQSTTIGAYAIYNNDAANNANYGKLYNWYAVADPRGLCPTGWHVPSDTEWATLANYLGGDSLAGGKMKSMGTIEVGTGLWQDPNTDATNSSGFTGLPGGFRDFNGSYFGIGNLGFWWSSTEFSSTVAWCRYLYYNDGNSSRENRRKTSGFSVRCLRD